MKLSLVNDEEVLKLMKAKFTFSHILFCALERCESSYTPTSNGKIDSRGSRAHSNTEENWMESMENQWSSSGRYSQDTQRCRSSQKSKEFMQTLACEPEFFQGRAIFTSMLNDIDWRHKDNDRVCSANALIVSMCAKWFAPLVIPRTRIRNEVECDRHFHAWRIIGQSR